MTRAADRPVVMAAITGAHGIDGGVRLKLFCNSAQSLQRHRAVSVDGRPLTLRQVRATPSGAIARFAEVADRSAAEALRGKLLTVARASLPPLGPGEFYWHDLIGLPVVAPDGAAMGTVVAVENFGASDLIEVERAQGGRVLVPLIPEAAVVDDGRVVVAAAWLM